MNYSMCGKKSDEEKKVRPDGDAHTGWNERNETRYLLFFLARLRTRKAKGEDYGVTCVRGAVAGNQLLSLILYYVV